MDTSVFDKATFVEQMMNDEELAKEIAAVFLDTIPKQISALKEAFKNGDEPATILQAHTIKGASANVAANALRKICEQAENAGKASQLDKIDSLLPQIDQQFDILKKTMLEEGMA